MASRKSETQKASNLRRLKREGNELSAEQSDWLDRYEDSKRKPGRPPAGTASPKVDLDDMPEPVDLNAPNNFVGDPVPPPVEMPDIGPLPSPPKIAMSDPSPGYRGGDWREKYRQASGGSGREQTCTLMASYWVGALQSLADALLLAGIDPIIEPKTLAGSIVLTCDEIIPDHIEVTPKMQAVGGSTALLVQRFIRREEIAKAQKIAKEREAHEEWKAHRKDPPPPTDITSHPDFKSKEDQQSKEGDKRGTESHAPSQSQVTEIDHPAVSNKQGSLDLDSVW